MLHESRLRESAGNHILENVYSQNFCGIRFHSDTARILFVFFHAIQFGVWENLACFWNFLHSIVFSNLILKTSKNHTTPFAHFQFTIDWFHNPKMRSVELSVLVFMITPPFLFFISFLFLVALSLLHPNCSPFSLLRFCLSFASDSILQGRHHFSRLLVLPDLSPVRDKRETTAKWESQTKFSPSFFLLAQVNPIFSARAREGRTRRREEGRVPAATERGSNFLISLSTYQLLIKNLSTYQTYQISSVEFISWSHDSMIEL